MLKQSNEKGISVLLIGVISMYFFMRFFLVAPVLHATTRTATTCSPTDVQTAIGASSSGDTVIIPGPVSPATTCTWTSGVTVAFIGITITGVGTPNNAANLSVASASCATTNITWQPATNVSMFTLTPNNGAATSRISCMRLVPGTGTFGNSTNPISATGICNSTSCPNLRIDNISFPPNWACHGISDATFAVVNNVFGVADHNSSDNTPPGCGTNGVDFLNVSHGSWQGLGSWGDQSWASPDTLGTLQAFYCENDTFHYTFCTDADRVGAAFGGGRLVCRFLIGDNVSGTSICGGHGTDTTGRSRGVRQAEYYANTQDCTTPSCSSLLGLRSGVAIAWGNTYTGFINNYVSMTVQRPWRVNGAFGPCDGSSPWDTNDGTVYYSGTVGSISPAGSTYNLMTDSDTPGWTTNQWAGLNFTSGNPYSFHDVTTNFGFQIAQNDSTTLTPFITCGNSCSNIPATNDSYQILRARVCLDQPARSGGNLITGTTPVLASTGNPGPVNQAIDPIYDFAELKNAGHGFVGSQSAAQVANRDFFQTTSITQQSSPTSPFSGASGTGFGTIANRPPCTSGCLNGVGYWAINQGNWNSGGNPTYTGQGQLSVLTAPGVWTVIYTPAPYPHPLIQSGPPPQLITLSSNKKFFVNGQTQQPVFLTGDAPQLLTLQLCLNTDITQYLTDRANKNFNALWVIAVDQLDQNNQPQDGCGNLPFTSGGLTPNNWFGTMNPTYWNRIDAVISQASALNQTIFLQPSFIGNHDGNVYDTPQWNVAGNQSTIVAYCNAVATRYLTANNIVYLLGGDYDPSNATIKANLEACASAMHTTDPTKLITIEGFGASGGSNLSTSPYTLGTLPTFLTANFAYDHLSSNNVIPVCQSAFGSPGLGLVPFQGEDDYELEGGTTAATSRLQGYWQILSGCYGGRLFGNGPIWSFNSTHSGHGGAPTWQSQLSSGGSVGQQYIGTLMNSREHWLMVPDISHTYLLSGFGTGNSTTVAARSSDGQTIIVYDPVGSTQPFTMNLSGITSASSTVRGWWYYPQTGAASLFGTRANSGNLVFTPPDNNDWVLVLDDAGAALTPPGGAQSVSFNPPTGLNFGSVGVGVTSSNMTLTITANGPAPLTWASVSQSAPANVNFNNTGTGTCPLVNLTGLAVGQSCTFVLNGITNVPGLQSGTFNLPSNAPGSPQTVPLTITGIGGAPAVSLNPTSLIFPLVNLGSSSLPQTSILLNTGTANLTWTSLVLSGPFTFSNNNCPLSGTLTANSSCNINVIFKPLLPGTQVGSVTLTDNAPGSPHVISLTGTGQALGVPTQVFAINLAGCKAGLTTTWCFTADGKIYVDVCNPACGTFKPLTMSGTLAGTTVVN